MAAPPVDALVPALQRFSPPNDLAAKLGLLFAYRESPRTPPPPARPAAAAAESRRLRTKDSWADRLRDTSLAKQLSFLKDKAAERVVRGQASKEVEKQYGGARRLRAIRAPRAAEYVAGARAGRDSVPRNSF